MADWKRASLPITPDTRGVLLGGIAPTITLRSSVDAGPLRVGLWITDNRLAGWTIPFLPANVPFTIRNGKATAFYNGQSNDVPRQLRGWDGARWPSAGELLPVGTLTLTLDQVPGSDVPVLVDVSVEAVES